MLERFPNSVTLNSIAGDSNTGLMKLDAAIACYKEALKIKPDYVDAYYHKGNALKNKGDSEATIESYEQDWENDYIHITSLNVVINTLVHG